MLTAKDAKEDVIDGLNSGADDYLGKPFEPQEFITRVRAVLRVDPVVRRRRGEITKTLSASAHICIAHGT
jgi:DNA-binding response OmpR family regulator